LELAKDAQENKRHRSHQRDLKQRQADSATGAMA
jgi:hypothetical protein